MGVKVTFHPDTRIIQIDVAPVNGVIELDFKVDVYSDGKEDWITTPTLTAMTFPIRSTGGDPTPDGFLGATFYIDSTWKIRPYEGDHWLIIDGNIYSEDGSNPFVATVGTYNVQTQFTVSAITTQVDTSTEGAPVELERKNSVYTVLTRDGNGNTLTAKIEVYTDNTKQVLDKTYNLTLTYDGVNLDTHEMVEA